MNHVFNPGCCSDVKQLVSKGIGVETHLIADSLRLYNAKYYRVWESVSRDTSYT